MKFNLTTLKEWTLILFGINLYQDTKASFPNTGLVPFMGLFQIFIWVPICLGCLPLTFFLGILAAFEYGEDK